MIRLGIDLGTTRTVVAAADRGNFPVVSFLTADEDAVEHVPTVTAEVGGVLVHGHAAERAYQAGAPALRSWKRLLNAGGPDQSVSIGSRTVTLLELVTGFLSALRLSLLEDSSFAKLLTAAGDGPLEAVVSVPANAHSSQRFVTLEAFRRAGFDVRAIINEPSAAGMEYAHRHQRTLTSNREHVVVYDLGGGTFDAALVRIQHAEHDVVATSGVSVLGGDDFDRVLLQLAIETAGLDSEPLTDVAESSLLEECRSAKESLVPQSRRIPLELAAIRAAASAPVSVPVAAYYERTRPLIEQTLEALEPVLSAAVNDQEGSGLDALAGIYMVGGASGLPAVPRIVREKFGRRVHRSPHPSAATAIGLAIFADAQAAPALTECFTRHFGVFRESNFGEQVVFDGIFDKGTPMPKPGDSPLVVTRRYRAGHNIGHFRFVESGRLDGEGQPLGDITPHGDIFFAFDAADEGANVQRIDAAQGPLVEERYEVDPAGIIAVTLTNLEQGRHSRFIL